MDELLNEENEEAKAQREHEKEMLSEKVRGEAFMKSPVWFTIWDTTHAILEIAFWLCFLSLIVQCNCKCLMK